MDRFTSMSSFVQVVDGKSFSRAARQLKLSQATVTGHVHSLEQQLGVRLLNRPTRKVSLTEEGLNFINDVSEFLRKLPRSRT
jgi:DNA-binding transcriptional LysR family regulator